MAEESFLQTILRYVAIYMFLNMLFSSFSKQPSPPSKLPVLLLGSQIDLAVFTSHSVNPCSTSDCSLLWHSKNISFGNWSELREFKSTLPLTAHLRNNGSLFAHYYLIHIKNSSIDSSALIKSQSLHPSDICWHYSRQLNKFMPKRKKVVKRKLVSSSTNEVDLDESPSPKVRPIVSYWPPNVTLEMVAMENPMPLNFHPKVLSKIPFSADGSNYLPIFYQNDFWILKENMIEVASLPKNTTTLDISITFRPAVAFWKFQMYLMMEESFQNQIDVLGQDESDVDKIKAIFLDTNPWLLGITVFVSMLHSLFDFLAFKNDVQFWRNQKNLEGLSIRTVALNIIQQIIILLYLFDNDTSTMILISSVIGLAIEFWKIQKSIQICGQPHFPYFQFKDKNINPSKLVQKTRKYDQEAFEYLSWVLVPLLIGYTVYSFVYEEHKGVYSFVVNTLVGFVYLFGFISMTPQLWINYKLKSVAHMPWKTFMYKALNTFIDDLFAFVIKMPWLHRLACLRDDVVFLIYLYQRWIYREDSRRRNEFGQVADGNEGEEDDKVVSDDELLKELESKKEK